MKLDCLNCGEELEFEMWKDFDIACPVCFTNFNIFTDEDYNGDRFWCWLETVVDET